MNSSNSSVSSKPAALATKHDKSAIEDDCYLPKGFVPGEHDIVIGRSMKYFNHSGNRALRKMVASRLEEYSKAEKSEKSFIITEVMDAIRNKSQNGDGFLKIDPSSGLWYKVGEYLAREKVSQTFRDALGNYRSSSQCKKERRKMERALAYTDAEMRNAKRLRYSPGFEPSNSGSMNAMSFLQQHHMSTPSPLPSSAFLPQEVVPKQPETSSLFDMLASVLPADYDHDTNPFEPTHILESNNDVELFEPAALFEPSPFDTFQSSLSSVFSMGQPSSCPGTTAHETYLPINVDSSFRNTLHAMSA